MNDPTAQAALDRALDGDSGLTLVYQPIHDARSGAIWSAEALLRQRRSDGELREASIITEAAEESAGPELFALDSMLVRQAYTDAAGWDVRLNVNLSPREFEEGNVLVRLTSLLTSCGIDRRKVNLEITETSYIQRPEETVDVLRAIKKLGVGLWLDDFGTGHSSLSYLKRLPLDEVKIDRSFVMGMTSDDNDAAIVRTTIDLARNLGLEVVAEGVESQQILNDLSALSCDVAQGFFLSRPLPAADLDGWLHARVTPSA